MPIEGRSLDCELGTYEQMIDELRIPLIFGALLHDIGKVIYRAGSNQGNHSKLGADFLLDEIAPQNTDYDGIFGRQIIEQVRYHHADALVKAKIPDDSLAYITYFADNISAGMDRKEEGSESGGAVFDRAVKLRKIFNILNGHHDDNTIEHEDYNKIREDLKRNLIRIDISWRQVNSLINLLEATVDKIPSSTKMSQLVDVSLFDHLKTTAGISSCIFEYLAEQNIKNYRSALFDKATSKAFYSKPMFLLYSCDMSGIQDFIYTISGSGALKQLRARSLYLEMLLEHITDELLARLGLSRANLLYTGGGHAYLLLPNTLRVKKTLQVYKEKLNEWFLKQYRTDLYLANAWVECSGDYLANKDESSERYRNLYRNLSSKLSAQKASRYSASTIRNLNFSDRKGDHSRECTECHRSDLDIENGKCPLCLALGRISSQLIAKDVFVVSKVIDDNAEHKFALPLPFGYSLCMYSKNEYIKKQPTVRRVYTKNSWNTGIDYATHIWMGDYTAPYNKELGIADYANNGATFSNGDSTNEELGIKRLGVLRADVDNLGATFVNGLPDEKVSLSRTSTLSRALSYFFKYQINEVLKRGDYRVQIIYSGGDDLFIIGNWSDIMHAATDIHAALDEFTGNGTLTISAGIGMFDAKYPIASMAEETGALEDAAKLYVQPDNGKTKNAIALWSQESVFGWEEFIQEVVPLEAKIHTFFDANEKGKAFIYSLVALLRDIRNPISLPRLAYLLARSFEDYADGKDNSRELFDLAMDKTKCRYLLVALEWYVYSVREKG